MRKEPTGAGGIPWAVGSGPLGAGGVPRAVVACSCSASGIASPEGYAGVVWINRRGSYLFAPSAGGASGGITEISGSAQRVGGDAKAAKSDPSHRVQGA